MSRIGKLTGPADDARVCFTTDALLFPIMFFGASTESTYCHLSLRSSMKMQRAARDYILRRRATRPIPPSARTPRDAGSGVRPEPMLGPISATDVPAPSRTAIILAEKFATLVRMMSSGD